MRGLRNDVDRCFACGGPYHPSTGHVLSKKAALCGPCAIDFYKWYRQRMKSMNRVKPPSTESWNEAANKGIDHER